MEPPPPSTEAPSKPKVDNLFSRDFSLVIYSDVPGL